VSEPDRVRRRARRLLRWYPAAWRERYGEEFVQLLIADMHERPRCASRTFDVFRGGMLARLTAGGLVGDELAAPERARARLAGIGCCLAVCVVAGAGMWAAAPIVVAVLRVVLGGGGVRLRIPVALVCVGTAVRVLGGSHFARGWPGTGGHPWAGRGVVPGGLASFAWASTLSVTSYWAHPAKLGAFPGGEVAWMALAPVAIGSIVVGTAKIVRRVRLSSRVLRYEMLVARLAIVMTLVFFGAAVCRIVTSDTGPRRLFSFGSIDVLEVGVMGLLLVLAVSLARRSRSSQLFASRR
jgi:hypothetical protein